MDDVFNAAVMRAEANKVIRQRSQIGEMENLIRESATNGYYARAFLVTPEMKEKVIRYFVDFGFTIEQVPTLNDLIAMSIKW